MASIMPRQWLKVWRALPPAAGSAVALKVTIHRMCRSVPECWPHLHPYLLGIARQFLWSICNFFQLIKAPVQLFHKGTYK
ncbi:hypothetical protein [uncultured Dysgonomonas sp.]|uniref:hypothetical protein n=1 Tax=uncultured Dysgonomonas sp. TaxID=206096 RepID=UPI002618CE97|nr:hypothetical protein [uncultured Dysgonomonas sp.]